MLLCFMTGMQYINIKDNGMSEEHEVAHRYTYDPIQQQRRCFATLRQGFADPEDTKHEST